MDESHPGNPHLIPQVITDLEKAAPEPLAWLDALAETHAKATEGVWSNPEWTSTVYAGDPAQLLRVASSVHPADAAAIVAAHNAMPELLALIERMRGVARDLRAQSTASDREGEATGNPYLRGRAVGEARSAYAIESAIAALAGPHTADEERPWHDGCTSLRQKVEIDRMLGNDLSERPGT